MLRKKWVILLIVSIAIKIFSLFPELVERYYSRGVYPVVSRILRFLFGWVPFSLGDLLYFFAGLWLVFALVRFCKALFKKQFSRQWLPRTGGKLVSGALVIYIVFNLFWGLNYNRVPMMRSLTLDASPYTTTELKEITDLLVVKTNDLAGRGMDLRSRLSSKKYLFDEALQTYRLAAGVDPLLKYSPESVKPSLYSYAGNYLGFTGYYNPFSGEAQTNTTVPVFVQPFTTCHEIGHQLGYAKENEANFAGFLACRRSANPAFLYSVYFDMLTYSLREMQLRDSLQAKELRKKLGPQVVADIKELKAFYLRYDNMVEPVIRILYSNYLRANDQPQGMKTYNQVVAMMVAYYRKYGSI